MQDGRIVKLGSSRRLGSYVILRDLYGDEFTYAGLGSIAKSYRPAKPSATPLTPPAASHEHGQGPRSLTARERRAPAAAHAAREEHPGQEL